MYAQLFEKHAQLLKSVAHPRRLEIIHLLRDQALFVTDIYEMLDLPQANVSQHLMILRDAGVVKTTREGKQIQYQLAHPAIITACDAMRTVLVDQLLDTKNELTQMDHSPATLQALLDYDMQDFLPIMRDPVCNMRVSPKTAGGHAQYEGTTYYFCASGCETKFNDQPTAFIQKDKKE